MYEKVSGGSNVKTVLKEYTGLSNSNSSGYYIQVTTHLKTDIGASKILGVMVADWQGTLANGHPINVAYNCDTDILLVMFTPHTFSNVYLKITVMYEE